MLRVKMRGTEPDDPATEPGTGLDWIDQEQGERIPNQTESGTETKHRNHGKICDLSDSGKSDGNQRCPKYPMSQDLP